MGFEYVGERSPELVGLSPEERRKQYLVAARQSYRCIRTWIGLFIFILLALNSKAFSSSIYLVFDKHIFSEKHTIEVLDAIIWIVAWVCLGGFQVSAIRHNLNKGVTHKDKVSKGVTH